MKKTPIFEEVFLQLFRQKAVLMKLLIGGALSFVPVINLFAFGYLYRFSAAIRRGGRVSLPEWSDWGGLFVDGLRFAVVWLLFWLLPVAIVAAFSGLLEALGLGVLAYLFLVGVLLLAPLTFCAALYRLQRRQDLRDLSDLRRMWQLCSRCWDRLLVPVLVVLAVGTVLLPLYGFAFFVGHLVMLAYSPLCFRWAEQLDH